MNATFTKWILCATALWLAVGAYWYFTSPNDSELTVQPAGMPAKTYPFAVPYFFPPTGIITVRQTIDLHALHPTKFVVYSLDRLSSLKVNDQEVAGSPPRSLNETFDLSPYLHPGTNQVEAEMLVTETRSYFFVMPSIRDGCRLILLFLCCLAAIPTLYLCLLAARSKFEFEESLILFGAIVLRLVYSIATPCFMREFDYQGHAEYIEHFTKHIKLPQIGFGWESYQPPLYYALLGFPSRILEHLGLTHLHLFSIWQFASLLMSIATVGLGAWISRLIYADPADKFFRWCFLAIVAFEPLFVYNAARINNDLPEILLAFLWLGLLLKFWREPLAPLWILLSLVIALAILTKSNGLPLLVVSWLVLVAQPGLTAKSKFLFSAILVGVVIGLDGWYEALRFYQSTGVVNSLVSNTSGLPAGNRLTQSLLDCVTFNPWEVIKHPYVETVGYRIEKAPEFFFKSAFLSVRQFSRMDPFAPRAVLLTAMLLLPFIAYGLIRKDSGSKAFRVPMLILFGVVLLAHLIFIRYVPFAPSQDFRYSAILIVPIAYFLLSGITGLPGRIRPAGWTLLFTALATSVAYILGLSFDL